MFLAMDVPFKLGAQLKRPNQGYAVDNFKNSHSFYKPTEKHSLQTKSRKRSLTFPVITRKMPLGQMLLQDHVGEGKLFAYSLEGKKLTYGKNRKTPKTIYKLHKRPQSMPLVESLY